jgi:hypothetical protein
MIVWLRPTGGLSTTASSRKPTTSSGTVCLRFYCTVSVKVPPAPPSASTPIQ